jgi:hypothetical protein
MSRGALTQYGPPLITATAINLIYLSYLSAECLQSQFADVQCDDGIEGTTESLS